MADIERVKEGGNFYFIQQRCPGAYGELLEAESKSRTDPTDALSALRRGIELFYKAACREKDLRVHTANQAPSLYENMDALHKLDAYRGHAQKMRRVRQLCNSVVHPDDQPNMANYQRVLNAMKDTFAFLVFYYEEVDILSDAGRGRFQFFQDYSPIRRFFVTKAYPRDTAGECVLKCLAQTHADEMGEREYALVKVYDRGRANAGNIFRDFESLRRMWKSVSPPPNVANYALFDTTEGAKGPFHILYYQLPAQPVDLGVKLVQRLSLPQRLAVYQGIVRGLHALHNMAQPIYHRNLEPGSVVLCEIGGEYHPLIVNFEYAKVVASAGETVLANVKKKAESSQVFAAPELRFAGQPGAPAPAWDKADIYSLGMLAVWLFTAGAETAFSRRKLEKAGLDGVFVALLDEMVQPGAQDRPDINRVWSLVQNMSAPA